jgi:hypothetical protein
MARRTLADGPPILAGAPNPEPAYVIGEGDKKRPTNLYDEANKIINRLSALAKEQVTAKKPIEERWIKNLRQYHGLYDPTTEAALKDANQSRAFVKLARAKTVTLEARLYDLMFPTDDRNWDIGATPVPKLEKEIKQARSRAEGAAEQANIAEAAGDQQKARQIISEGNVEASRAQAAEAEIAKATEAADAMREEMDDQLVESSYPQECRRSLRSGCQLGTGLLKGPMVNQAARGAWMPQEDGRYALEYRDDPRPLTKWVDPWAFFPDMSARTIEEAEFTFERHLWTKSQLRKMVKTHGFNPDGVRYLLQEEPKGRKRSTYDLSYLTQIREITGEGSSAIKGRYVGWEYHGPLEHDEIVCLLRAMGEDEVADEYEKNDDPLEEVRVVCFFCENQILKIAPEYPLDSGETLYSVFNVEQSEASIFGYGVPHIMSDTGSSLNSAWRMALDNGGMSVGPQAVIDKEAIVPADGDWTMKPKKVWFRTKAAIPNAPDPVSFFNVPNNMGEIASIIKIALEFIDMETGISQPLQGEQGNVTKTVGGMAILENASNIIFRRVVKNCDDGLIVPTMRRLYDWNMQHNPREDIKGDMAVNAKGASVLLVKEVQAQNLMFVVQQLLQHPSIAPMLKPYENVRKLFQSMMISPEEVMETKDAYLENMKRMAEQQGQEQNPAVITAQARIEAANITAKSRAMSDEMAAFIAQLRERTELLRLVEEGKLTMAEYETRIAETQLALDSKERMMAAEIGAERIIAAETRERGEEPTGSGGFISAGSKKADGQ